MLEFSFPGEVLLYHGLALLAVWIQFAPVVWFVVNLPVWRQLEPEKTVLFGCERFNFFDELLTTIDQMKDYPVENIWTITVCTEMQKSESCAVYDKYYI